ncbi:MAG: class II fumarate hydratase [Phycisphaerae bacterium]
MATMRTETDSMGSMEVPADALYGAQTARAVQNFPISGWTMPREFIGALGLVKQAAAMVNRDLGLLEDEIAKAIIRASEEVINGEHDDQFVVDVFQTGSGTSTNMNANEVIANRAVQILGGQLGDKSRVHPNDHVNRSQSSNDVIPTALHIAAATEIHHGLVPELRSLRDAIAAKSEQFNSVVKVGRTHLMDAVPIRLGQEFGGYAVQLENGLSSLGGAVGWLCELPLGGTAVGTGLNCPEGFAEATCHIIASQTNLPFRPARNRYECIATKDAALFASSALRSVAVSMGKIASDIRLMGSGPRCGLGELKIPAVQPGSSIMPGKVNPVICESVIQVACQVVGCDAAVVAGATGGVGSILELNVAMPMIASNVITSARLLANVSEVFEEKCIVGLEADAERCESLIEHSLAMITVLAPEIGYDAASEIAKEAFQQGRTVRELCRERGVVDDQKLDELLNPRRQTGN